MFVLPRRNIAQRALNRATHRFGIKPFPVRFECSLPEAGAEPDTVFNAVYESNYWESNESKSGSGSELKDAAQYIPRLAQVIRDLGIESMFDAPCGDLNWMPQVIDQTGIDYIGGDIAKDAVAIARSRRPDLDIRLFDICADDFPCADLWHCRDTFFHLDFANIRRALDKAKSAVIEYAAITTHRAIYLKNLDVKTGGFRLLDLHRPPFSFPRALRYLRDYPWGQFPRYVGIWKISDLP
jgi:hypothetical protein